MDSPYKEVSSGGGYFHYTCCIGPFSHNGPLPLHALWWFSVSLSLSLLPLVCRNYKCTRQYRGWLRAIVCILLSFSLASVIASQSHTMDIATNLLLLLSTGATGNNLCQCWILRIKTIGFNYHLLDQLSV